MLLSNFAGVGVVGEDIYIEGGGQFRDDFAYGAEADDAKGLTLEFESTVVNVAVYGVFPSAGLEIAVEVGDAAGEGEHEAEGVFRHGAGVASGCVDDDNAVLRCGVEVDVVEGGAADADELEVCGELEEFFEDEVGFDDEVGYFFPLKTEAEFFRILEAAGVGPAFVVNGHELLQGRQGGRVEGGQDEGPQFWRPCKRAWAAWTPLRTAPSMVEGQPVSVQSPAR